MRNLSQRIVNKHWKEVAEGQTTWAALAEQYVDSEDQRESLTKQLLSKGKSKIWQNAVFYVPKSENKSYSVGKRHVRRGYKYLLEGSDDY